VPAMYLACGLAGLAVATALDLVGRVLRRPLPAAGAVAVGIVCVAAAPRLDLLWRMWTPQREFEFFRAGLSRIDPGCQLVALLDTEDAGFIPFGYLRPGMVDTAGFLAAPSGEPCVVYYRGANCWALDAAPEPHPPDFEMNPTCHAIE